MGLKNANRAYYSVARARNLLPKERLLRAVMAADHRGVSLAEVLAGDADVPKAALEEIEQVRARHGRRCSGAACGATTYLLPGQGEEETPCDDCGAKLVPRPAAPRRPPPLRIPTPPPPGGRERDVPGEEPAGSAPPPLRIPTPPALGGLERAGAADVAAVAGAAAPAAPAAPAAASPPAPPPRRFSVVGVAADGGPAGWDVGPEGASDLPDALFAPPPRGAPAPLGGGGGLPRLGLSATAVGSGGAPFPLAAVAGVLVGVLLLYAGGHAFTWGVGGVRKVDRTRLVFADTMVDSRCTSCGGEQAFPDIPPSPPAEGDACWRPRCGGALVIARRAPNEAELRGNQRRRDRLAAVRSAASGARFFGLLALLGGAVLLGFSGRSLWLTVSRTNTGEAETWAMVCHLAAYVGPVGILIVWLVKKGEHPEVDDAGRRALDLQITLFVCAIAIILGMLCMTMAGQMWIPMLLVGVLGLYAFAFPLVAAVHVKQGKRYRFPFSFHFLGGE